MAKTFLDLQNLRASKINEAAADKILDVDLARFYNETVSDMAKFGSKLKTVTTDLVSNQANYGEADFPGFLASANVKISGIDAPYVDQTELPYSIDRNITFHTIYNNEIVLNPAPTANATDALVVEYWSKLPEIIDAATDAIPLTDLDDADWNVVTTCMTAKMYEKLLIISATMTQDIPDATIESLFKIMSYFSKKADEALENYGNANQNKNYPARSIGPASRENETPTGLGRQNI